MIYFFSAPEVGRIKVGFAKDWVKRFMTYKWASACLTDVIVISEGSWDLERRLHRCLSGRHHGEWYSETPEILDICARLTALAYEDREAFIVELVESVERERENKKFAEKITFNPDEERALVGACVRTFVLKHGREITQNAASCGPQIVSLWEKRRHVPKAVVLSRMIRFDPQPFHPYFAQAGGIFARNGETDEDAILAALLDLQREIGALICCIEAEKAA